MKVCVIGGAGFIGTYLCCRLAEAGVDFEIVDLKRSVVFPEKTIIANIRDIASLRGAVTGNVIIHLAAVHRDDVKDASLYYATNVDGTRNVCKVAEEKGISRIVFTSSVAVYGFSPPGTGEEGAINPFNHYGKSKYEAELELLNWYGQDGATRSLTIIRPTVVFGVGNRGNVFNLLSQIKSGIFMMVGNGSNVKSLAYVENVAAFLEFALGFSSGRRLYNYADKPDMSMNALVSHVRKELTGSGEVRFRLPFRLALAAGYCLDIIARLTGRTFPLSAIRVRKFCADTCFSSSVHVVPGFTAPVSLLDGLSRTLQGEFICPDHSKGIFFTE